MRLLGKGLTGTLAGLAALLLTTTAAAGDAAQGGAWQHGQQRDSQDEMEWIENRLFEIQDRTLDANPDLKARLDNLESMAKEAMIEAGHDPDTQMKIMSDARARLQDKSLSDVQHRQALEEAREARQKLHEAELVAMQDEAVAEAHSAYRSDLMDAMREQAPELDQLIERFQQMQQGR